MRLSNSARWLFVSLAILWFTSANGAEPADLVKAIRQVGLDGAGNVPAARAMRELTASDADAILVILPAFEGANPLATNYLRGAFESIADRAVKSNSGLPKQELEAFIVDTKQNSRARRLAYEWLIKVDATAADRLIPGMLLDPGPEFRRDAVRRLIAQAKELQQKGDKEQATAVYQQALQGASDPDVVKEVVEPLKSLGENVDLQRHFGFLTKWQLIGPFDNREKIGFATVYPPEEKPIDLKATYTGQLGEVKWTAVETQDDYGIIDIAKSIAPYKGAVMYATTEFHSDVEQPVEFRLGTVNAWKLWVNGEQLFTREEYHRGMAVDQYRVNGTLKPGKNTILLKVCQNEQEQDWAQRYQFQIRICDKSGLAVLSQEG